MEKILEELVEVTYRAGLLHGQGLLGSIQHKQATERSKQLFQELMQYLANNSKTGERLT